MSDTNIKGPTPGPWEFRQWMHTAEDLAEIRQHEAAGLPIHPVPCVMNNGERVIMSSAGRVALVDCQTPVKRGQGNHAECAERDANARLIAAAPDLLAALKRLCTQFPTDADMAEAGWANDAINEACAAYDAARAAISKAEQA
jgi:hypothetical protein